MRPVGRLFFEEAVAHLDIATHFSVMIRTSLALAFLCGLMLVGCGGGQDQPNGTCSYQGQTFTEFITCPGSTVCCPTYDHCDVIVGGGYSCGAN